MIDPEDLRRASSGRANCPRCESDTSQDDHYCQECGCDLAEFSIASPQANTTPAALWSPSDGPAETSTASRFLSRLHPRAATPVVALPLIILGITALAAVPCACLWIESSYSSICAQYAFDKAKESFKEGRLDEAIAVMERSSAAHKLDREERAFLDQVYVKNSDDCAHRHDYVAALSLLAKVTPALASSQQIKQQQAILSALARTQQSQMRSATRSVQGRVRRLSKIIGRSGEDFLRTVGKGSLSAKEDPLKIAGKTAVTSKQESLGIAGKTAITSKQDSPGIAGKDATASKEDSLKLAAKEPLMSREGSSTKAAQSDTPAENLSGQSLDKNRSLGQLPGGSQRGSNRPNTQSDVAKYNELLEQYFSVKKQSATPEPPSFKEWVNEGKPNF